MAINFMYSLSEINQDLYEFIEKPDKMVTQKEISNFF